jgi:hypothetical protein
MNAAIDRWRKIPTSERFYRELSEDPDFKAALEAAYARDPTCMTIDAASWRPNQFNADVPPARPNERDPFGPGARDKEARLKPIPGAAFPS